MSDAVDAPQAEKLSAGQPKPRDSDRREMAEQRGLDAQRARLMRLHDRRDLGQRVGEILLGHVAAVEQDLEARRQRGTLLAAMRGRDVQQGGQGPALVMRRWREGGDAGLHALFEVRQGRQHRQRCLDRVHAVLRIAGMRGAAADAHEEVEAAEAAGPDARRRAAVEAQQMSLHQPLLGKMADAGIQAAFLVGAEEQHGLEGDGHSGPGEHAQRAEHRGDGALHVRRAAPEQGVALPGEGQRWMGPAIARRYCVDVEIDAHGRPAGIGVGAPRQQVDPLARRARRAP
jgi:hypothetical protein